MGCCLVILLIIGLVLGLVVFDNRGNDRENAGTTAEAGQTDEDSKTPGVSNPSSPGSASSPTFSEPTRSPVQSQTGAPTIMPTMKGASTPNATPRPTLRPTVTSVSAPIPTPTSVLQPSPSQIIILPYADTFIYRDGFSTSQAFGTEDTFLVQNGPGFVRDDVADAVGLLAFDVAAGLSAAGQSATAIQQITLRLSHEPAVWDRGAATLTIRRLPSTQMAIETLHAGLFDPADDEGVIGPSFSVSPDDTTVDVDVTDLLLSSDPEDVFLMVENKGAEQSQGAEGDRFFTRETNDPPQLVITV